MPSAASGLPCAWMAKGQRQQSRRLWAGTGASIQAPFGTQAARPLLSGPEGSPEQAAALLERRLAASMSAAVRQGTLTVLLRRRAVGSERDQRRRARRPERGHEGGAARARQSILPDVECGRLGLGLGLGLLGLGLASLTQLL